MFYFNIFVVSLRRARGGCARTNASGRYGMMYRLGWPQGVVVLWSEGIRLRQHKCLLRLVWYSGPVPFRYNRGLPSLQQRFSHLLRLMGQWDSRD